MKVSIIGMVGIGQVDVMVWIWEDGRVEMETSVVGVSKFTTLFREGVELDRLIEILKEAREKMG